MEGRGGEGRDPAGVSVVPPSAWHSSAIKGLLLRLRGLGGGMGGCLGADGGSMVLGAGEGVEFAKCAPDWGCSGRLPSP